MNKESLISIIVPIYNVENYIQNCIDSILSQTYRNLEIILVDDGSPDHCPDICDQYAAMDKRVKTIHKKNGGLSDARNVGLDVASGEYIGFIDSDDFIESDMYKSLYDALIKYKTDISVCGRYIVEDNNITSYSDNENPRIYNRYQALREIVLDDFYDGINNFAWDKLYKKELFENIRYPVGKSFEDIYTTYKLFSISNKVVHIKSPKYYYVQRGDSIVGSNTAKKRYDYYLANVECLEYIKSIEPLLARLCDEQLMDKLYKSLNDMLKLDYKKNEYKDQINQMTSKLRQYNYSQLKNNKLSFIYKHLTLYSMLYPKLKLNKKKIRNLIILVIPSRLLCKMKDYRLYTRAYKKTKGLYETKDNKNRIFLIGTPLHGNLGDQAIAYAEIKILDENFKDYETFEISTPDVIKNLKGLKKNVKQGDIFVLHGGGNLGDEYFWEEQVRRKVIRAFVNNKIILFPQSIYFHHDKHGIDEFNKTKLIYSKHKNLTLVAREKTSYEIMKQAFSNNNVILTPDIVMYLNKTLPLNKRKGAILCLRSDREGILSINQKDNIENSLEKNFDSVISTDTIAKLSYGKDKSVEYMINPNQREKELNKKWKQFKKAELVITDRLHGMLFCAITSTPCIAISNYNQKVSGTYEWIKNLDYIKFVNDAADIPKLIDEIKNKEDKVYDNSTLIKNYEKIFDVIKEGSN